MTPKYCPDLFGECPAGYMPRPGFDTISGQTLGQCCQPKPSSCADNNVACSPHPFVVRKPDYSTITGNTAAQCCNYLFCPDFPAAACIAPNYIPRPGFATYLGQTVAECCVRQTRGLHSSWCAFACPPGYTRRPDFNILYVSGGG